MREKHTIDMLHGPLVKPMVLFALPLALTGILQQLFNTADVLVLGQFVGTTALAAVGNNSPIIGLLVNLFMGVSLGANVVIARFIGAHNLKETTQAVHTSFLLALILGVAMTVLGELMAAPMLQALGVPSEVMASAELYLRVYLLGLPAMGLYNFESAIFRSRGDTQTPLKALAVASVLNIVLNLAAVAVLDWGIAGVAAATAISSYVSAWMLYDNLCHAHGIIRIEPGAIRMISSYAKEILRIGVPAGVQGMVFSLSIAAEALSDSYLAMIFRASHGGFGLGLHHRNQYLRLLVGLRSNGDDFCQPELRSGQFAPLPECYQGGHAGSHGGHSFFVGHSLPVFR